MAKAIVLENLPAIQLLEDITRETAARVISQLSVYKGQRVALEIFSNGGDVHGSQAVAAYIANPANQLHVEARIYGNAASGAMIIASACQTAYIAEGAFALVHKARAIGPDGPIPESELPKEERNVIDAMNADQVSLFQKRTGMTPGAIEKLMEQDRDMPADEAVEKGFFDGIIPQAMRLAAFKQATMSNETKPAVRVFKVDRAVIAASVLTGEVPIPEDQIAASDDSKVKQHEARIAELETELATEKAAKEAAETAKATAETEKATEVAAKAAVEVELVAAKTAIEVLTKKPAAASVTNEGTTVVIPGKEATADTYVPTPNEARANAAMDAYRKAKQNIKPVTA